MHRLIRSKFFIAVLAFGALSIVAGVCQFWQAKPTDYPYRSWTAWAIDDFLHQQQKPDLVFMGSSLMLVPLAGVDADFLNRRLDGSQHHRSLYFENGYREKTGFQPRTFNFALPGEMPSDAYMITDFLLKDDRRPQVLVYGVGPRDFMDNLLPSPAATDPFRFLSRFGDISSYAPLMMPQFNERLSYELGRAVYFYGHKIDLADRFCAVAAKQVNHVAPLPDSVKPASHEVIAHLLPEYRPFELQKGEAFFRPSSAAELNNFVDNVGEYRKRYKTLKRETFNTQLKFFHDTLQTARERGIQVVVVAMPITDINRGLLSASSWNAYHSSIQNIAASEGATFIDSEQETAFNRSDFGDTVHLHSRGGKHFIDMLIAKMAQNQHIRTCLKDGDSESALSATPVRGAL